MSAECPECMWDLPLDGDCIRCRLEEERDEARVRADRAEAAVKKALALFPDPDPKDVWNALYVEGLR